MDANEWNAVAVECLREAAAANGSKSKWWLDVALAIMRKAEQIRSDTPRTVSPSEVIQMMKRQPQ